MLKRWTAFTRFLGDGPICLSNNAAERALRGITPARKAWLFAGSERGGECAAIMYTLIQTATLNDVDPRVWLADVLARIADHPITGLALELEKATGHYTAYRRCRLTRGPRPIVTAIMTVSEKRARSFPNRTSVESRLLPWRLPR
jgi:Transposase IS66 family/IS66 C-terminal element